MTLATSPQSPQSSQPHRSRPSDPLDAFLQSIRHLDLLEHEEVLELSRTRDSAELALRRELFSIPEVADALIDGWSERRSSGRVTGVMAEDDGTSTRERTRRVDGTFESVLLLRAQRSKLRGRARVGIDTQAADQLHSAGLALHLLLEVRRELPPVRGPRARSALQRADRALERWTEVRGRLVRHNLRLVVRIAQRFRRDDVPLLDLIQEGVIGLVRAAEKFDPDRGFRFSTYAVWWIEQALIRALQKQARTVRLPAHVHEQQLRYRRASLELDARHGETGSDRIAERLGLSVTDLDQIEASLAPIRSLDAPTAGFEEGTTLAERIADANTSDPTESICRGEIRAVLQQHLRSLSTRELTILSRRFGLDGSPPETLDTIGSQLGLSRERVRQIERSILKRLREEPSVQSLAEAIPGS